MTTLLPRPSRASSARPVPPGPAWPAVALAAAAVMLVTACSGVAGADAGTGPGSRPPAASGAPDGAVAPSSDGAGTAADAGTQPAGPDLTAHSTSDPASPWVVVNKRSPLDPVDHEPDLVTVRGYLVRPDAAPDLAALLDAADADGVHLTLRSAYRGYAKQAAVYDGWVAQLGAREADEVSARPGYSEHQTGLAVDVGGTTTPGCDFEACFGGTPEGRWVAGHAAEHGFLVRYTPGNQAVTGYAPEPWHLRWVGRELAEHLRATGVSTLEEAFGVPGGDYAR
ncbi:D-alanyl-D-alanine carboxypeptidase family protein [Promicromonospora thailandica]|uniref:D-alanyl-D-alanine carboxypeptidase n=1 Tax=Promicromonospora thailandica TaxID=765201 RepID=A0A9X2GE44_9MICO|nr:D-alanyl-D-alanine carboxypeptidase family protein [Promicromonospora thailandica]MCP2266946.1 D-alanyl-D-alanine carboxypeptidase [Promicromonospora thailandica]BFF16784.1 hypothetical protein GCM10025730_03050 [Promicromonospora thailandica]